MIFNSWDFVAFLAFALAGYYATPTKYKTVFATLTGLYFYSFWSIKFASLIIISSVADYYLAIQIEEAPAKQLKKMFLLISLAMNLGFLGFFKYFNFFAENIYGLAHQFGWNTPTLLLNVVLPVGISFYTFQEMSYTIDVYRGVCPARRNYFDVAAFIVFFPHLVAGPIQRSNHLLTQLENPRTPTRTQVLEGLELILWGLFEKVVIADNISHIANYVFDPGLPVRDTGLALVGAYSFAIQIYCDFAGYTDIARGVAKLFGVDFMKNFNRPYFATSLRDFWTRWHISLSTWLRDYLYIPLGGNRGTTGRVCFNLMVTMLLGGLWHGPTWLFVLWGGFHGALLVMEHLLDIDPKKDALKPFPVRFVKAFMTFNLVCFGWILFRAQTLQGFGHWWNMFTSGQFQKEFFPMWYSLILYTLPLVPVWVLQTRAPESEFVLPLGRPWVKPLAWVGFAVALILFGADKGREFIYFQF